MKKVLLFCATLIIGLALTVPAMAELKLTSKGLMQVRGVTISESVLPDQDSANSFYYQKLEIEPLLHITDKVRIFSKVTILETTWDGTLGGSQENLGTPGNYSYEHNFWWEQLYLSFPLFDGTMYVGRMPGGAWAYPFMDDPDNRNRIKYVTTVGPYTLLGLIEKLSEGDGGIAPMLGGPTQVATDGVTNVYGQSASDIDAYALGAVIPFSKQIIFKPLIYFVNYQSNAAVFPDGAKKYLSLNGLTLNFGPFRLDLEADYIWGTIDSILPNGDDRDWQQFLGWVEGTYEMGPFSVGAGAWYIQGQGSDSTKSRSIYGMGYEFQPLLIATGDMAQLFGDYNGSSGLGVANGTGGFSGFQAYYARADYKLTDNIKFRGIFGWLDANTMYYMAAAGKTPDKNLGWEVDGGVDWKLMENLTWSNTVGYFSAGDYFDDVYGDSNSPWMGQTMLMIAF